MAKESFLVNRLKSIGYAFKGLLLLIRTEASIQVQLVFGAAVTLLGLYFDISKTEWILQILCIAMVMGVEGMNTAVEKLSDFVQPDYDKRIGFIKDIAAGAVLWTALMAAIVGGIIYVPRIFEWASPYLG